MRGKERCTTSFSSIDQHIAQGWAEQKITPAKTSTSFSEQSGTWPPTHYFFVLLGVLAGADA
jgi:hypothetical protein